MPGKEDRIGIIAGGGRFPLMVAESARKKGLSVISVAHYGETDPALSDRVDKIIWIDLGQLERLIRAFKENGVSKALMAGTITKSRMFGKISPDQRGLALIYRMTEFHDDGILRALAEELAVEGIEIISSIAYLPELTAPPGCLTKRTPDEAENADILFGWRMAKEIGRLDVGQCVVVRNKTVLSLEALEGTDETILRGGKLAREKAVVVKVSKPNQDLRFDVPSVGPETVKVMSEVKASVLVLEAGKTLIFDRPETIASADEWGISIVSR